MPAACAASTSAFTSASGAPMSQPLLLVAVAKARFRCVIFVKSIFFAQSRSCRCSWAGRRRRRARAHAGAAFGRAVALVAASSPAARFCRVPPSIVPPLSPGDASACPPSAPAIPEPALGGTSRRAQPFDPRPAPTREEQASEAARIGARTIDGLHALPVSHCAENAVIVPLPTDPPVPLTMCVIDPDASDTVTMWCIETPATLGVSMAFAAVTSLWKTL